MAEPSAATAVPRTTPVWKRWLRIAVPLVVLAVVFLWLFWPTIKVSLWINGLGTENVAQQVELEQKLTTSPLDLTDRKLEAALEDEGRGFRARVIVARILEKRQRLTMLERILREGSPGARRATMGHLVEKDYFVPSYFEDPAYGAKKTLLDWLADPKDKSRSRAVQIALRLPVTSEEAIPLVRPLLARAPEGDLPAVEQRELLIAAATAVAKYKDCDSLPTLERLARSDPDEIVRMRALQWFFLASSQESSPCAAKASPEALQGLLSAALEDPSRLVRMGGLEALTAQQPAWMKDMRDRVFQVLDGSGDDVERRSAIRALASAKDDRLRTTLPKYFHDRGVDVRTSAVDAARGFLEEAGQVTGLAACLVGTVRFETGSEVAFQAAVRGLRVAARTWVGLPEDMIKDANSNGPGLKAFLHELYVKGESRGIDREAWATGWSVWCSRALGASEDEARKAEEVRTSFWAAAKAGDAAKARAALSASGLSTPGIFTYEDGWLLAREGK